jgi:hypothetical protein
VTVVAIVRMALVVLVTRGPHRREFNDAPCDRDRGWQVMTGPEPPSQAGS